MPGIRTIGKRAMQKFRPSYVTFDCYGTLTYFQMTALARERFSGRVSPRQLDAFVKDFSAYRFDEVLGSWKPYPDVILNALARTCRRWNLEFEAREAREFYEAVPSWGPHADVPDALARVAEHYPLVILSNASDTQIDENVAKLGAPFHAVYTAEQAQAYKPRFRAFEYMFDELNCGPRDVLHVSSSIRYDLIPAYDLGVANKVYVNRGYDPSVPFYEYHEIDNLADLPGILGL